MGVVTNTLWTTNKNCDVCGLNVMTIWEYFWMQVPEHTSVYTVCAFVICLFSVHFETCNTWPK